VTEDKSTKTAGADIQKLAQRLLERVPASTTQGTFYARQMAIRDIRAFADYFDGKREKSSMDLRLLGELLLKSLVCTGAGPEMVPALSEEIYSKLTGDDICVLAGAVAKASSVGPLREGDCATALGTAMLEMMTEQSRMMAESAVEMKRMLDKNFGSLSATLKAALGQNLTGLSAITERLTMSPAVEAIRRIQEDRQSLADRLANSVVPGLQKNAALLRPLDFEPHLARIEFPKVEDTPIGRAAIAGEESARQLQEVVGLIGQMSEQLGRLHALFLTEVIPQWVKNIEDGSKATNTTLNQAERSLFWAKWAICASIVVTVLVTGWQLGVARDYKRDHDRQQNTSEDLLRAQFDESLRQDSRLAEDSKELRAALASLEATVASSYSKGPVNRQPHADKSKRQ